jgi:hypothetical protein
MAMKIFFFRECFDHFRIRILNEALPFQKLTGCRVFWSKDIRTKDIWSKSFDNIGSWSLKQRRQDIQHNDTQYNDTQHNDTRHNDTQHSDTQLSDIQHNNKKIKTNSMMALLLCWVFFMLNDIYAVCHK